MFDIVDIINRIESMNIGKIRNAVYEIGLTIKEVLKTEQEILDDEVKREVFDIVALVEKGNYKSSEEKRQAAFRKAEVMFTKLDLEIQVSYINLLIEKAVQQLKEQDKLIGEMKTDGYNYFLNEFYPNIVEVD